MKLGRMIKREARAALRGNRGIAVAMLLVVLAVFCAINMADAAAMRLLGYSFSWEALDSFNYSNDFFYNLPALSVTVITMLIRLVLSVPLGYGIYNWYLELTDRRRHGVSHIFWPYEGKAAWRGILLSLNVGVKMFFMAQLLLVLPLAITFAGDYPGLREELALVLVYSGMVLILVALLLLWAFFQRFAIAPILLCEKYQLTTHQAIKQSVRLTRGHRWELVRLELSFLPWLLPLLGACAMAAFSLGNDRYSFMPMVWVGVALLVGLVTYLLLVPYYQMSMVMYARYLYECGQWQQNATPAPDEPTPAPDEPISAPDEPDSAPDDAASVN